MNYSILRSLLGLQTRTSCGTVAPGVQVKHPRVYNPYFTSNKDINGRLDLLFRLINQRVAGPEAISNEENTSINENTTLTFDENEKTIDSSTITNENDNIADENNNNNNNNENLSSNNNKECTINLTEDNNNNNTAEDKNTLKQSNDLKVKNEIQSINVDTKLYNENIKFPTDIYSNIEIFKSEYLENSIPTLTAIREELDTMQDILEKQQKLMSLLSTKSNSSRRGKKTNTNIQTEINNQLNEMQSSYNLLTIYEKLKKRNNELKKEQNINDEEMEYKENENENEKNKDNETKSIDSKTKKRTSKGKMTGKESNAQIIEAAKALAEKMGQNTPMETESNTINTETVPERADENAEDDEPEKVEEQKNNIKKRMFAECDNAVPYQTGCLGVVDDVCAAFHRIQPNEDISKAHNRMTTVSEDIVLAENQRVLVENKLKEIQEVYTTSSVQDIKKETHAENEQSKSKTIETNENKSIEINSIAPILSTNTINVSKEIVANENENEKEKKVSTLTLQIPYNNKKTVTIPILSNYTTPFSKFSMCTVSNILPETEKALRSKFASTLSNMVLPMFPLINEEHYYNHSLDRSIMRWTFEEIIEIFELTLQCNFSFTLVSSRIKHRRTDPLCACIAFIRCCSTLLAGMYGVPKTLTIDEANNLNDSLSDSYLTIYNDDGINSPAESINQRRRNTMNIQQANDSKQITIPSGAFEIGLYVPPQTVINSLNYNNSIEESTLTKINQAAASGLKTTYTKLALSVVSDSQKKNPVKNEFGNLITQSQRPIEYTNMIVEQRRNSSVHDILSKYNPNLRNNLWNGENNEENNYFTMSENKRKKLIENVINQNSGTMSGQNVSDYDSTNLYMSVKFKESSTLIQEGQNDTISDGSRPNDINSEEISRVASHIDTNVSYISNFASRPLSPSLAAAQLCDVNNDTIQPTRTDSQFLNDINTNTNNNNNTINTNTNTNTNNNNNNSPINIIEQCNNIAEQYETQPQLSNGELNNTDTNNANQEQNNQAVKNETNNNNNNNKQQNKTIRLSCNIKQETTSDIEYSNEITDNSKLETSLTARANNTRTPNFKNSSSVVVDTNENADNDNSKGKLSNTEKNQDNIQQEEKNAKENEIEIKQENVSNQIDEKNANNDRNGQKNGSYVSETDQSVMNFSSDPLLVSASTSVCAFNMQNDAQNANHNNSTLVQTINDHTQLMQQTQYKGSGNDTGVYNNYVYINNGMDERSIVNQQSQSYYATSLYPTQLNQKTNEKNQKGYEWDYRQYENIIQNSVQFVLNNGRKSLKLGHFRNERSYIPCDTNTIVKEPIEIIAYIRKYISESSLTHFQDIFEKELKQLDLANMKPMSISYICEQSICAFLFRGYAELRRVLDVLLHFTTNYSLLESIRCEILAQYSRKSLYAAVSPLRFAFRRIANVEQLWEKLILLTQSNIGINSGNINSDISSLIAKDNSSGIILEATIAGNILKIISGSMFKNSETNTNQKSIETLTTDTIKKIEVALNKNKYSFTESELYLLMALVKASRFINTSLAIGGRETNSFRFVIDYLNACSINDKNESSEKIYVPALVPNMLPSALSVLVSLDVFSAYVKEADSCYRDILFKDKIGNSKNDTKKDISISTEIEDSLIVNLATMYANKELPPESDSEDSNEVNNKSYKKMKKLKIKREHNKEYENSSKKVISQFTTFKYSDDKLKEAYDALFKSQPSSTPFLIQQTNSNTTQSKKKKTSTIGIRKKTTKSLITPTIEVEIPLIENNNCETKVIAENETTLEKNENKDTNDATQRVIENNRKFMRESNFKILNQPFQNGECNALYDHFSCKPTDLAEQISGYVHELSFSEQRNKNENDSITLPRGFCDIHRFDSESLQENKDNLISTGSDSTNHLSRIHPPAHVVVKMTESAPITVSFTGSSRWDLHYYDDINKNDTNIHKRSNADRIKQNSDSILRHADFSKSFVESVSNASMYIEEKAKAASTVNNSSSSIKSRDNSQSGQISRLYKKTIEKISTDLQGRYLGPSEILQLEYLDSLIQATVIQK